MVGDVGRYGDCEGLLGGLGGMGDGEVVRLGDF